MDLTSAEKSILRDAVLADPVFSTLPPNGDSASTIAAALNAQATPSHVVWQSAVPINDILNAIEFAKMTPAQTIPTTGSDAQLLWLAKASSAQAKQMNLQNLIIGREVIAANRPSIRAAFQDCLTQLPTTAAGGNQAAGWPAVQTAMQRTCTRLERLFAVGTGTPAFPATMAVEGSIDGGYLKDVMGW